MNENRQLIIEQLIQTIPELTSGQLHWVKRVVSVFSMEHKFVLINTDLFNEITLNNFGDAMRVHHSFSSEPFSKDKFEYILVNVLKMSGHEAKLAPKGNPGHDISVDGVKLSLKTQADKNIKEDLLWISKFMELGKGNWGDDPKDLLQLRGQFLSHIKNYGRILSLRAINKGPSWKYELVEIPKEILLLAKDGSLEMKLDSSQYPKPGYCHVSDNKGQSIFSLYFDGGGERKLQVKNLKKSFCKIHAKWEFFIPQE